MIDKPEIVQTTAQHTAFIHLTIPRSEIRHVMGPGLQELAAALKAQGVTPTGPWFTHHLRMEPGTFDFEISFPRRRADRGRGPRRARHAPLRESGAHRLPGWL